MVSGLSESEQMAQKQIRLTKQQIPVFWVQPTAAFRMARAAIRNDNLTGRFGRGPSVAPLAGFGVEQTFERQRAGD